MPQKVIEIAKAARINDKAFWDRLPGREFIFEEIHKEHLFISWMRCWHLYRLTNGGNNAKCFKYIGENNGEHSYIMNVDDDGVYKLTFCREGLRVHKLPEEAAAE